MACCRLNVTLFFSIPHFSQGFGSDSNEKRKSANNLSSLKNVLVYIEIGEYYEIFVILTCVLRKY
jgi:hypothetical protein